MYPTTEKLDSLFPGKGQEITNLLTGKVSPNAYVSVLRRITSSCRLLPHHKQLMIAIAEIVGASPNSWFEGADYYGFETLMGKIICNLVNDNIIFIRRST